MHTEVVTSFSLAGAAFYGRRCVESIYANWPHPIKVYADVPMAIDGVTVRTTSDIPKWTATRDRLPSTRPDAPITGTDIWTRKPASYLWNAQRYAVKAFVWHDAAPRLKNGYLVWLDADTVTTAAVPDRFITDLMHGADVAYLGRGTMHPETGFVAFRLPEALPLLRWCRDAYLNGRYLGFNAGWTDCHVLRAGLAAVPVKARDLTSHLSEEWNSSVDAVALSPLGQFVTHLKGSQRKREAAA